MITVRAVAIAALTVVGWLFWGLALLMTVYVGLAWRSGDPAFKIAYLAAAGMAAVAAGITCRRLARRVGASR